MAKHFGSCRPKSRTRTRLNADQSASAYPSLRSTSIIFASPPNDRSFLIQKLRRKRALLHIWQRSRQTDKFGRQVLRPVSRRARSAEFFSFSPGLQIQLTLSLLGHGSLQNVMAIYPRSKMAGKLQPPGLVLGSYCLG